MSVQDTVQNNASLIEMRWAFDDVRPTIFEKESQFVGQQYEDQIP